MTKSKLLKAMNNRTLTENGAQTFVTTLDANLDFYYHASAKRGRKDEVLGLFVNAFTENPELAIKGLFYLRDIRGGNGERDLFRYCLDHLYQHKIYIFRKVVRLVPFYGRWDDILMYNDYSIVDLVVEQLNSDLYTDNPSLLGKWLPSCNTSSKETNKLGRMWAKHLGMTEKEYRQMLSSLRAKINIVERKMSANEWKEIDYESVPSKASLIYRKAFGKHDQNRYAEYLVSVEKGEKKINSAVLYPYELVRGYNSYDKTKELQWKSLPDYLNTNENILVMCDVSGSMMNGQNPQPIDVSISLAIYAAERNKGLFHNHFITFTNQPKLVSLEGCKTLLEKIQKTNRDVGYDTNIQAAFDLILDTAKRHKLNQSEMPTKLFIVSDMEFNSVDNGTNFDKMKQKYANAGYTMPTLVFWNVASRNMQTPVTMNEDGVYLVSGCSSVIFKNALNCKATNPYEQMLEVLNGERYSLLTGII
jgi:hypothetical protein